MGHRLTRAMPALAMRRRLNTVRPTLSLGVMRPGSVMVWMLVVGSGGFGRGIVLQSGLRHEQHPPLWTNWPRERRGAPH
jgi:hypothetical protein